PTDLPIACALTASELPRRLQDMADLGQDALLDAETGVARARLRFAAGAGVRDRVSAIVTAEAECCAFLAMCVTYEADAIVLTIDAPEGAAPVLAQVVDAFRGVPQAA
ncbi:MAG: hypothetical protein LC713_02545, partial [Actinobacteria bacterium]|nr:hypothetical protein [Actinomycetota bacterium]